MKDNVIDLNILLDKSGSMFYIKSDKEGAINSLFEERKKDADVKYNVTLYKFDHMFEKSFEQINMKDVAGITIEPRGSTSLIDACCKAIDETGARLSKMAEYDRPSKVMFVIVSDGAENSSNEFSASDMAKRIQHQEQVYKWTFLYLGANQDAYKEGAKLGIAQVAGRTFDYQANAIGTKKLGESLSRGLRRISEMEEAQYCNYVDNGEDIFNDKTS